MQRRTVLLYIVPAIALAITLWATLPLHDLGPDWKLQSEPLHSAVEAIGALAGILMALLLIVRQEDANSKSFLLGLGFLGMGLLDSFHAISAPGSGFVLLHSTAVLVGGMGFALVWLPKLGLYSVKSDRHFKRFAPWLLAAGSVGFSAMVLLYRGAFPAMTANGVFTSAAVAINVSAGLLYLLGALHFFLEYRRNGNKEFYLFYLVSLLFGFSGLTFMYSQLWSDEWWVWHFVRLAAFIAILGFLAVRQQGNASELARLNRVYAVLSRTNGAMVRIRDPQKLYEETCRIAVEDGRFGMAWVGLLAEGANAVTPVAQYGTDGKGVPIEDLQRGRGPVSTAVREERQIICNDIERDPWMRPWRDEALGRGYRSLAAFPLRAGGRVIGALAFYAREPNFFSNGEVRLLEELASDVSFATEYKEQEERRRQADTTSLYVRGLIEASLDPLVTISPAGKITDVNNATEQVTGIQRAKLIGSDFSDYFTEPEKAREGYRQVFSRGFVRDYPLAIRHTSGRVTDVLYNATVYKDEQGSVKGVFAAARDITERKRAEEKLLQSASIIEFSDDAIIAKGLDGTITGWNPGAEKMYGYPAGEAIGRNIALIAPPDRKDEIPEILKRIRKGEYIEHYETVRVRKDGKRLDISITISPIKDKEGNIIGASAIGRDITEKKQAEERLQESEKKFRNLVESVPVGIAVTTPKGEIIEVNPTILKIFGYAREEFEKLQASALYYDPKARERFVEELLKKGKVADFEAEFKRKDGSVFWGSITTTSQKTASGKTQFLNAFLDITERKRAEDEIKKLNVELEAFSYSVSHDLRAPLRSIDGFSQALLEDCGKKVDARGRDDIRRVRAATAKMAELIDAMLVLSRVTRGEMRSEAVDLSGIARAVANELKASEPGRKAEFVIADGISAKGDPDMLQTVLQNLLENSWKFTSKHKKARIEFGTTQRDGKTVYFVRDDGAGFDMQYAEKLFQAFQRLHSAADFPGIGIGLATVQRIICRHGGKIWAEGAVEKGATFHFTL